MSSLVNSREFEGKIVDASEVELALVRQENGQHAIEPSRYRAIVDSLGNECGHVSHSSYTLVTNTELLSAFDLVADSLGLEIEPKDAHYAGKNGKAQYSFYCPQYEIQPTGDPSKSKAMIRLGNGYGGSASISLASGNFRLVCSNGLWVYEIGQINMQKHVGQFNLFEWLKRMTQRTIDRFAVDKLLADSLVEVPLPASLPEFETKEHAQSEANSWNIPGESATDYLIASIYAGTAERYYPDLAHQFHSYAHEVGRNYWALAQAVSDIATHRMQQTAGGDSRENFNWSADQWASRQLARISKVAGIR